MIRYGLKDKQTPWFTDDKQKNENKLRSMRKEDLLFLATTHFNVITKDMLVELLKDKV